MRGFVYRLGVRIKNLGEKIKLDVLIRIGLLIRDKAAEKGL